MIFKNLLYPTVLTNSNAVIYTASTKTYIKAITLHNITGNTTTFFLYLVPNSGGSLGTPAINNRILAVSLEGFSLTNTGETYIIDRKFPFILNEANDALFGYSLDSNAVTITLDGGHD